MNQVIDTLAKLSLVQKLGIAIVIYLAVFGLFHFVVYQNLEERLGTLKSENGELEEQYEEYSERAEHKDQFEREVDELNEAFSLALRELPDSREIPDLLRRISTIGKKIGLEFLLFQPLPEVTEGFYAQVPVRIEVEGSYHEVAMFFDRIGKLNRIVNIQDISMGTPVLRSGKVILRTTGRAITYRFLSDAEAEEQEPQTRRRRRR